MSLEKPIDIHPSQRPDAVERRLFEALLSRRLPARFLYDSPAQASRWLAYHAAWSPSRTEASLLALYERSFDLALDELPGSSELTYVSLGCGGGTKDARFLERASSRRHPVHVVLTDTSPSLVEEAMNKCAAAEPRGLVVDLEARPSRGELAIGPSSPVLFTAFGMVPNLDADDFLRWLASILAPSDRALVSANLHPTPWPEAEDAILPQYDNREARAWYQGALDELGLTNATLRIEGRPSRPDGQAWRIEVEAVANEPARLGPLGDEGNLEPGERLALFFSNRFTPDAFSDALRAAGLEPIERLLFDREEEGIWLVRSTSAVGAISR